MDLKNLGTASGMMYVVCTMITPTESQAMKQVNTQENEIHLHHYSAKQAKQELSTFSSSIYAVVVREKGPTCDTNFAKGA